MHDNKYSSVDIARPIHIQYSIQSRSMEFVLKIQAILSFPGPCIATIGYDVR